MKMKKRGGGGKIEDKRKNLVIILLIAIIIVVLLIIVLLIGNLGKKNEIVVPAGEINLSLARENYDAAIEKKDEGLCDRIPVRIMKETCKIEVNVKRKNAGYCSSLSDENLGFAELHQNKTIEFTLQQECRRMMAVKFTGDCSILGGEQKDVCEQDLKIDGGNI